MVIRILLILVLFFHLSVFAENVTIDLQNTSVPDALRILAKSLHKNIILSASVHGNTSLHLQHMTNEEAFAALLASEDLRQWRVKNTWYIAPHEEYIQRQQLRDKWKTMENELSPIVTRVWQIHYAKAVDIAHLLEDPKNTLITKRGYMTMDPRTNMIYVRDIEASMESINRLIRRLDIPVRQVLIEAHLASIDNDCERELGIHFGVNEASSANYSLAVIDLPNGSRLDVQLAALERAGHGELISSPSLFTANQQTAAIESGEEIPYQESSSSGATSVTFKKAVLSLKVMPQIMPNNEVLLQLQVNQDRPTKRLVLGVPSIDTRQIKTNIKIKAGQTIVLGGIYETSREESREGIPWLSHIPILGWLFRQQSNLQSKRELLIFVTPRIID